MKHVDIRDVEAQLPSLLEAAENGERVVITRGGAPVAQLLGWAVRTDELPVEPPSPEEVARRRQAMTELREMARRRGQRVSLDEIKAWIDEGRP